jgi:tRNA pseudouridine55 synthase
LSPVQGGPRRRLDAVLLLDKPPGLTSNAALQAVKRLFGASKAGHAGTLDPLASGLLPVLFGEATKFAAFASDADKEYLAQLKLGESTTTGDAEGEVTRRLPVAVTATQVEGALARFRGRILQVPPMYSALKRGGRPLYRLAREGVQLELEARPVEIRRLELVRQDGERCELLVSCSKGTYIRSLAVDLGNALGTGAHLSALRRTAVGGFRVEDAATPDALRAMTREERELRLLPVDRLLAGLPRIELDPVAAGRFEKGQSVAWAGPGHGPCAVYRSGDGSLIGVGEADAAGRLCPRRLTAVPRHEMQPAEKHRQTL